MRPRPGSVGPSRAQAAGRHLPPRPTRIGRACLAFFAEVASPGQSVEQPAHIKDLPVQAFTACRGHTVNDDLVVLVDGAVDGPGLVAGQRRGRCRAGTCRAARSACSSGSTGSRAAGGSRRRHGGKKGDNRDVRDRGDDHMLGVDLPISAYEPVPISLEEPRRPRHGHGTPVSFAGCPLVLEADHNVKDVAPRATTSCSRSCPAGRGSRPH